MQCPSPPSIFHLLFLLLSCVASLYLRIAAEHNESLEGSQGTSRFILGLAFLQRQLFLHYWRLFTPPTHTHSRPHSLVPHCRMLRATRLSLVRLPKTRRPRERPWEIMNTRDFGFHEGSQNNMMWLLSSCFFLTLLGVEMYQQWLRILARGDTCPACEAAREHYRHRVALKEFETDEVRKELSQSGRKVHLTSCEGRTPRFIARELRQSHAVGAEREQGLGKAFFNVGGVVLGSMYLFFVIVLLCTSGPTTVV
eukprot:gene1133-664_t